MSCPRSHSESVKELRTDTQTPWSSCFSPCPWLAGCHLLGAPLTHLTPASFFFFFFRGSVLEPEGTVEIKFRKKDLVKAMRRIDSTYKKLVEQLGERVQNAPPPRGREARAPPLLEASSPLRVK